MRILVEYALMALGCGPRLSRENDIIAVHYIDLYRLEVYRPGLPVVAPRLSRGGTQDDERRSGAYTSLCAYVFRARAETGANWATRRNQFTSSQTERERNEGLGTLPRRLHERVIAAPRMAYSFLREAETGEVPELCPSVKRLSINAMSEPVLEDAGHSDLENVETRIWRPSRPVIHLASAVHGYLQLYSS